MQCSFDEINKLTIHVITYLLQYSQYKYVEYVHNMQGRHKAIFVLGANIILALPLHIEKSVYTLILNKYI